MTTHNKSTTAFFFVTKRYCVSNTKRLNESTLEVDGTGEAIDSIDFHWRRSAAAGYNGRLCAPADDRLPCQISRELVEPANLNCNN